MILDKAAARVSHVRHSDRLTLSEAKRMEDTPEGFLWCRDVPLARTGTYQYLRTEVPCIPPAPGSNFITVERTEDEVFAPEAIESFRGKPFTDDHPVEDVTSANYREHTYGALHNPRRGESEHAHCLVGDILVWDPKVIAKIKSGEKRQISNGYDADYDIIAPGVGRQKNIRGNHIALVDEGRAGPICSIRDKRVGSVKIKDKQTFMDRLRSVFGAKDEAEREERLDALGEELQPDSASSEGDDANHHHVTVNIGGIEASKPKNADSGEKEGAAKEDTGMDEDKVKALIGEAMTPVTEALTAITSKLEEMSSKTEETGTKVDAVVEAMEDMTDPEDAGTQDAIARAEIIAPGIALPALDAKPGSKTHRDGIVAFERAALTKSYGTADGRSAIQALTGKVRPDFSRMPANEVAVVFRGVSTMVADANAQRSMEGFASATAGYVRDEKGKVLRPMNTADLAQIHRDHYAKQRA